VFPASAPPAGQQIAGARAGLVSVEAALDTALASAERTMRKAGYAR
jgi:hypothetical protein